ncbi:NUDIX hydrolase [Aureibacillus halotolerans]|uniref:Mutator protein MutT n=1 Tax=Aureibacillus halotolerans TaxID=1508390 RepID=A0A4R6TU09_9BACI|nr:NUDIX domain-containing protein [Aureibacillus halotolerans]TDQ36606.1 mutator protein MutT [Aureibacillus halotolerans]
MRERAAVIIIEKEQVALIRRVREGATYYVFPGGGVEAGETTEQAAKRDAFEELGVTVQISSTLTTIESNGNETYYFAQIIEGAFGTGTGKEFTEGRGSYEPVWVELSVLSKLDVRPVDVAEMVKTLV